MSNSRHPGYAFRLPQREPTLLKRLLPVTLFLVGALLPAQGKAADCRSESFAEAAFTVCTIDLAADDVRMFWRPRAGEPTTPHQPRCPEVCACECLRPLVFHERLRAPSGSIPDGAHRERVIDEGRRQTGNARRPRRVVSLIRGCTVSALPVVQVVQPRPKAAPWKIGRAGRRQSRL